MEREEKEGGRGDGGQEKGREGKKGRERSEGWRNKEGKEEHFPGTAKVKKG